MYIMILTIYIIVAAPRVTRFFCPPEMPRRRASPTIVSAQMSRPSTRRIQSGRVLGFGLWLGVSVFRPVSQNCIVLKLFDGRVSAHVSMPSTPKMQSGKNFERDSAYTHKYKVS